MSIQEIRDNFLITCKFCGFQGVSIDADVYMYPSTGHYGESNEGIAVEVRLGCPCGKEVTVELL